jgi:hypothetical protein
MRGGALRLHCSNLQKNLWPWEEQQECEPLQTRGPKITLLAAEER